MIHHLRQGRPPLGSHQDLNAMTQWLHEEPHPETVTPLQGRDR